MLPTCWPPGIAGATRTARAWTIPTRRGSRPTEGQTLLARVLARRGVELGELDAFFGPPAVGINDGALLPDAEVVVARTARAGAHGERVLVVGDFDADGLTGLAILATALRHLGLDVATHVPSRVEDGHGLSLRAVEEAHAAGPDAHLHGRHRDVQRR